MATTTTAGVSSSLDDVRIARACFEGTLLSSLAFGALVMLYVQVLQVLLRRPKRGRIFCYIVIYSLVLFPFTMLAFVGQMRFAESVYVDHRTFSPGPVAFIAFASSWSNVLYQICNTIIPYIADLLMFYRLMVVWDHQYWLLLVPVLTYFARMGISIPLLIATVRTNDMSRTYFLGTIFYSLNTSFNLMVTMLIWIRLFLIRDRAERVLGKLQATLYNSSITMFVESGGLFTIWSLIFLATRQRNSWVADVFLQPYTHLLALTRMLVILRMAQDRAWNRDIVTAAATGVLDWQVSSTNSMPLHGVQQTPVTDAQQISKKYRDEDSISSKSCQ